MGQKVKFVLSDLHLEAGNGHDSSDGRKTDLTDNQFIHFLNTIIRESEDVGQEIELIISYKSRRSKPTNPPKTIRVKPISTRPKQLR